MSSSDAALLSSVATQLAELTRRVTDLAEGYATTPDSQIAADLFAAERALVTAHRALERATKAIDRP